MGTKDVTVFFCMQVSSTICWKWSWHLCWSLTAHRILNSFSLICMFIPMSVPWGFGYHKLAVNLEIRKCESSIFVLFQYCFSYLEFLETPYMFEYWLFHFCEVGHWSFDRDYIVFIGWYSGFNPWVSKTLWRREWQSTPVFLLGESHGQRNLRATVHEVAKSRTRLSN